MLFGYGRFGKLFEKYFSESFDFSVYDPAITGLTAPDSNTVASAEYLFFAVPISSLEALCEQITPLVRVHHVLVDLCSVKEYPVHLLRSSFPGNEIIGTHPLFGPDSTTDGLTGRQIVLSPQHEHSRAYIYLENVFRRASLQILRMTPEEHDRQMAWTLCLTQYIGRALGTLPLPQNGIGTKGYFDLLDIVTRANADTKQLYLDMNRFNKYAVQMRSLVVESFLNLNKSVSEAEREQL